ncbi:MAG TPA: hypothetical protein VJS44_13050 [Pyrinomonadaceae bacterium]|nr:hypothetical protein [Pyrinomonadaceae bacterium]
MYCPSCGLQQTQELRYCPRCGANLAPASQEKPPSLVGPIWAVSLATMLITLAGLAFIFIFTMMLISRDMQLLGSHVLVIAFFMLIVLVIGGLLVRQLSRLLSLYQSRGAEAPAKSQAGRNELGGREAPRLEAVSEPPISITESTTRTFEPVPSDRQTKQNAP